MRGAGAGGFGGVGTVGGELFVGDGFGHWQGAPSGSIRGWGPRDWEADRCKWLRGGEIEAGEISHRGFRGVRAILFVWWDENGICMTREETIQELVRRVVEFYSPERVYLFGSAARGEDGPDSDFDFCVVLPDNAPERLYRDRSIHQKFWGLGVAVDVVRLGSSDFDTRAAHVVASLPATVVREGRLLYDARRVAA